MSIWLKNTQRWVSMLNGWHVTNLNQSLSNFYPNRSIKRTPIGISLFQPPAQIVFAQAVRKLQGGDTWAEIFAGRGESYAVHGCFLAPTHSLHPRAHTHTPTHTPTPALGKHFGAYPLKYCLNIEPQTAPFSPGSTAHAPATWTCLALFHMSVHLGGFSLHLLAAAEAFFLFLLTFLRRCKPLNWDNNNVKVLPSTQCPDFGVPPLPVFSDPPPAPVGDEFTCLSLVGLPGMVGASPVCL